jgi:hypothetical protein
MPCMGSPSAARPLQTDPAVLAEFLGIRLQIPDQNPDDLLKAGIPVSAVVFHGVVVAQVDPMPELVRVHDTLNVGYAPVTCSILLYGESGVRHQCCG